MFCHLDGFIVSYTDASGFDYRISRLALIATKCTVVVWFQDFSDVRFYDVKQQGYKIEQW